MLAVREGSGHDSGMKRGRPKLHLTVSDSQAESLRRKYRETSDVRVKERAQAVLLATGGRHTYEEIGRVVGRSRSTVQVWIADFVRDGLGSLETRQGKGGGRPTAMRGAKVQKELKKGLKAGRWTTEPEARSWLADRFGIRRSRTSVRYWLRKAGGAVKVPRPVHGKQRAGDAAEFRASFQERLQALEVPAGSRVRVWVQDEARFGLHTVLRRCWGLRGVRTVRPVQRKYQWGYLYGALEVVEGISEFAFLPSVDLGLTRIFLEQIADRDPEAHHVVIWDQAGFHPRPGSPDLPGRVHLLPLPPYCPELNPSERLWDILKDAVANKVYRALGGIQGALEAALRPYWKEPGRVRSLVGDGWMHGEANAMSRVF